MKHYRSVLLVVVAATLFPGWGASQSPNQPTKAGADCTVTETILLQAPETTEGEPIPATDPPVRFYVNEERTIWMYGEIEFEPGKQTKVAWFRPARSVLEVTGRRLDAEAPPLEFDVWTNPPYRNRFTPSHLTFPTEGCWEIIAKAENETARFVINVPPADDASSSRAAAPQPTETQAAAIAAIKELGGRVIYSRSNQSYRVEMAGTRFTNDTLSHAIAVDDVFSLELIGTNINDDGLAQLKAMKNLRSFRYSYGIRPQGDGRIGDAGLAHLSEMKQLTGLSVWGGFTDEGMAHLSKMTQLTSLNLICGITDAGVKHLEGLVNLKSLTLRGTRVTDAGLDHLKGMTELESLDLYDSAGIGDGGVDALKRFTRLKALGIKRTSVTREGRDRLQEALPGCWIH